MAKSKRHAHPDLDTSLLPIGGRVVVEPVDPPNKSKLLFHTPRFEHESYFAKVLVLPEGFEEDILPGDTVILAPYSWNPVEVNGRTVWFVKESDILMRVSTR